MTSIVIRNGQIVTAETRYQADILIEDGKISAVKTNLQLTSEVDREINAEGLLILPGGIDPHVHLSLPDYVPEKYRWADDFESGSKAAIAGGLTTLGCISVPDKEETLLGIIERETKSIQLISLFIRYYLLPQKKNYWRFLSLLKTVVQLSRSLW